MIKLLQFKEWEQIDHNNKKLLDQIKKCNSVSVHIRRGNYVAKGYLLVDEAYYRAAIDYMIKNVKEPHFFVFSDEIACAKEMFKSYDQGMFTYVSGNDGINSYKDMQLMSNCNNNIIANSTFSLCATFLNKHPNITIVPKVWSKGGVKTWENSKWIYL